MDGQDGQDKTNPEGLSVILCILFIHVKMPFVILRALALACLLAAILTTGACSRPKDAENPAAPVATPVAPLYSYAQTNDLRIAPQLTKGWYGVERSEEHTSELQ